MVSVCKGLLPRVNSALMGFHGPHPPRSLCCHQPRWGPMIHVPPRPEHRSCPIQLSWPGEKGHFFLPFGRCPTLILTPFTPTHSPLLIHSIVTFFVLRFLLTCFLHPTLLNRQSTKSMHNPTLFILPFRNFFTILQKHKGLLAIRGSVIHNAW